MYLSLLIEDDKWHVGVDADLQALIARICDLTISRAPVLADLLAGEREQLGQSVVLTNDAAVREMNKQFRTKDSPTNVLSFPAYDSIAALSAALATPQDEMLLEDAGYIGDMILARETILREAREQNKSPKDHLSHLIVHGTLHLLGYDHMDDDEAEVMEALEIEILRELSIANPYE
ncbi:MAG: rRNA maturation RNase YbeY [Alphaproteobacteria bacterium]|nr:rRNA maturation RNase YbeY [Alphaproteobacteria bacterium]